MCSEAHLHIPGEEWEIRKAHEFPGKICAQGVIHTCVDPSAAVILPQHVAFHVFIRKPHPSYVVHLLKNMHSMTLSLQLSCRDESSWTGTNNSLHV